jgi:purine-binding chemotaxis protein CheW
MAGTEHVTFVLAGQLWAVQAMRVREVVVAPALTAVPHAPVMVAGLLVLRGDLLCVLDPRPGLGLRPREADAGAVLVVQCGQRAVGFAVDEVLDVVTLDPSSATEPANPCTDVAGRVLQFLDVDRVAGLADPVPADHGPVHPLPEPRRPLHDARTLR